VKNNVQVVLMIDDLVSTNPWTVRGLEIRGTAVALTHVDPPVPFMSREVIRIMPTWVASWESTPKPRKSRFGAGPEASSLCPRDSQLRYSGACCPLFGRRFPLPCPKLQTPSCAAVSGLLLE
jgi:hypothetical protein